jgi:hypothetical protein
VTLNIDLEEVPFAILEAVKARIMRSREKRQSTPLARPSLRPRPQQRKFGASGDRWVRPRPAVTAGNDYKLARFWIYSELADDNGSFEFKIAPGRADRFLSDITQTQLPQNLQHQYNVVEATLTKQFALPMSRFIVQTGSGQTGFLYALDDYLDCYNPDLSSGGRESKVITGSQTEMLTKSIVPYIEFNHSDRYLVLPAGDGVALVAYLWNFDWYYLMLERLFDQYIMRVSGSGFGGASGASVYCVSDTAVRKVPLPSALQSVLEVIHPQYQTSSAQFEYLQESYSVVTVQASTGCPTTSTFYLQSSLAYYWDNDVIPDPGQVNQGWHPWIYQDFNLSYTTTQYTHSIREQPEAPEFLPVQFEGLSTYLTTAITPSIFASLNAVHQFIDPALIKNFPADLRWIIEDDTSSADRHVLGEYSLFGDPSINTGGFVSINRDLSLATSDNPADAFDLNTATGYTVWDWDDPDYCRQMCQALGFSSADLQP